MATVFELPTIIYDGIFEQGKLSGVGISYDIRDEKNKYIYGKFTNTYSNSHHYPTTFTHTYSSNKPPFTNNIEIIK
jgi:hypothetical protein